MFGVAAGTQAVPERVIDAGIKLARAFKCNKSIRRRMHDLSFGAQQLHAT